LVLEIAQLRHGDEQNWQVKVVRSAYIPIKPEADEQSSKQE